MKRLQASHRRLNVDGVERPREALAIVGLRFIGKNRARCGIHRSTRCEDESIDAGGVTIRSAQIGTS